MEILWGIMALVLVVAVVMATRRAGAKEISDENEDEKVLGHPQKENESWTLDSVEDTSESES